MKTVEVYTSWSGHIVIATKDKLIAVTKDEAEKVMKQIKRRLGKGKK
jgi:hypothetical protein